MLFIHQKKVNKGLKRLLAYVLILYVMLSTSLYLFQDKILFRPSALTQDYEFKFTHKFEEVFIKTDNEAVINAIHFRSENPKGVILYFHGNKGDLQRWGIITEYFVEKQYDVFVMDYRTYGKSVGVLNEEALYNDASFLYNYLSSKYSENDITVYGRSLGTTFATFVASKNHPKQLILESPYYSIVDIAERRFPFIPVNKLMNYQFPTFNFIKDVTCSTFIFHGTSDRVVPFSSGQKLFEVSPQSITKFISIDGASHNDLVDFELYHQEIDFIL